MRKIYSAITPSSVPTLGNYLGALKNWVDMQNDFECMFCVADLHSITIRLDRDELNKNSRALYLLLLALGLDPDRNIIYYQSHVHEHCELAWLLNCHTHLGELNRMTQFKDKALKHADNINAGLFTYPVLMAADILLYDTDLVPTGADQKQHVEIARDIALRFNNLYGDNCFAIPEPYINPNGARIMNLQDPTKKMSKSENNLGTITLFDTPDMISNKIKRAVTDSENKIMFADHKPGVNNLLNIYCAAKKISRKQAQDFFANKNYGELKACVTDEIINLLEPMQKKYFELAQDQEYVNKIILDGQKRANKLAQKKLRLIKNKIGLFSL